MKCVVHFALVALALGMLVSVGWAQASPPNPLWQVDTDPNGPFVGRDIWRLGDLDQDGAYDLGVYLSAAFHADEIHILSGATGAVIHSYTATSSNPAVEIHFGRKVVPMLDQDGDGVEDFLIFQQNVDASTGQSLGFESRILSGATGAPIRTLTNVIYPIAGVADYDGDGWGDILNGTQDQVLGVVQILSSTTGQILMQTSGSIPWGYFGAYVTVIGDVNGDGWDDFVTVEADTSISTHPSNVAVISGIDGSFLLNLPGTPTSWFGRTVARAGDVNGDGVPDFVVQRYALLFCSGVDGSVIYAVVPPAPLFVNGGVCTAFGSRFVGGEDLDGDGVPDLVIGNPLAPNAAGDPSA